MIVDRKTKRILCTAQGRGRRHDFHLFKESRTAIAPTIQMQTDTGYQGLQKLHANCSLPKKKSKKHPLTTADKKTNGTIASSRITVEHVIGRLKIFRILSERYRNRRRRFGLRFNLIAGIYNASLK